MQEAIDLVEGTIQVVQQHFNQKPPMLEQDVLKGMYLDNGCDELEQKAVDFEEGWVEVVQEVHDEALNVGAIMILVSHDHQVPIAQLLCAVIHLRTYPAITGKAA